MSVLAANGCSNLDCLLGLNASDLLQKSGGSSAHHTHTPHTHSHHHTHTHTPPHTLTSSETLALPHTHTTSHTHISTTHPLTPPSYSCRMPHRQRRGHVEPGGGRRVSDGVAHRPDRGQSVQPPRPCGHRLGARRAGACCAGLRSLAVMSDCARAINSPISSRKSTIREI